VVRVLVKKTVHHRVKDLWRTWEAGREYDLEPALEEAARVGKTSYKVLSVPEEKKVMGERVSTREVLIKKSKKELIALARERGLKVNEKDRKSAVIRLLEGVINRIEELL